MQIDEGDWWTEPWEVDLRPPDGSGHQGAQRGAAFQEPCSSPSPPLSLRGALSPVPGRVTVPAGAGRGGAGAEALSALCSCSR